MLTDGCQHGVVGVDGGGTRAPLDAAALARGAHLLRMDGPAVKRWVVPNLRKVIEQALNDSGLAVNEIDRFIFHQANGRLLEAFAAELGVGPDRVPNTAHCYGNTASASVPLTFHAAHRERPLERGERILFAAAGGGLTAAATVLIWH
jgi:3-oxoacyl-[acyl-carrier-protein] synthase-3